jgi:hypothetical protein
MFELIPKILDGENELYAHELDVPQNEDKNTSFVPGVRRDAPR